MSFIAGSIGAISQLIVPFGDIVQVILHIIIGIAMPGMPIIDMPAIIGFIIIGFIMPGIPPIIGIGMGIIGIICIAVFMALSIMWDELASSADLESKITMLITQSRIRPSLRFPPTSQLQRQQNGGKIRYHGNSSAMLASRYQSKKRPPLLSGIADPPDHWRTSDSQIWNHSEVGRRSVTSKRWAFAATAIRRWTPLS
ncbi:hypothetical protein [Rhodopseudomonas palustris]|uniref:hypothetical protein n=1 Tax=Rhodopseudomonas palustris TaxID=1076 RepID=UPI0021F2745A|nr:hypothetical protein [Rhodopseudomonas palustris]UYO56147.1 hypothetical protein KQX61_12385 [Rhodopseudomonas palustris]